VEGRPPRRLGASGSQGCAPLPRGDTSVAAASAAPAAAPLSAGSKGWGLPTAAGGSGAAASPTLAAAMSAKRLLSLKDPTRPAPGLEGCTLSLAGVGLDGGGGAQGRASRLEGRRELRRRCCCCRRSLGGPRGKAVGEGRTLRGHRSSAGPRSWAASAEQQ